jgi:hypothetical protein
MFPFPLDHIPFVSVIADFYTNGFDKIVFLIGDSFLGIKDISHTFNGSGDTTYEYVRVFSLLVIACVLSFILFFSLDKKINYEKVFNYLILYSRYFVGLYMLYYGFAKIFDGQFSLPGYGKLEQKFGDSSPMGLLWTFMGASKTYSAFSGYLELLGGYFVLYKRTKTLGSLITLAVILNVAMMNFCYDVPVKLFSSHLIVISLLIIVPDIKELYGFFLLHRPAQLLYEKSDNKYRVTKIIVKSIIIWGITTLTLYQHIEYSNSFGSNAPKQQIDGAYITNIFVCNNDTLPSLTTDSLRWKTFTIFHGISNVKKMTDSTERFWVQIDNKLQTIVFTSQNNQSESYSLKYSEKDDKFILSGIWKNKNILATFSKKTYEDYRLTNRGFHWINESPYNK